MAYTVNGKLYPSQEWYEKNINPVSAGDISGKGSVQIKDSKSDTTASQTLLDLTAGSDALLKQQEEMINQMRKDFEARQKQLIDAQKAQQNWIDKLLKKSEERPTTQNAAARHHCPRRRKATGNDSNGAKTRHNGFH